MAKWQSVLLGVAGLAVISASASAQGNRTIGGGPYGGQTVGGSGGLTGSSIGTAGGSGYGPTITNPHTGVSSQVGGGGGFGLGGKKK
jgi:hypothetical protein